MGRLQNTVPMPSKTVLEPLGSHQDQLFAQQATYPYSIERSMSVLIYPPMRMPLEPRPVPHALVNITPIVGVATSATRKTAVVDMSTDSMPIMSNDGNCSHGERSGVTDDCIAADQIRPR